MSRKEGQIVVYGGFDDIRLADVRLLQEAARLGCLHVLLWSDALLRCATGHEPRFREAERRYFVEAIRFVDSVHLIDLPADPDRLPTLPGLFPSAWVVPAAWANQTRAAFCNEHGLKHIVVAADELDHLPAEPPAQVVPASRKKVLVTGCYDWLHTGHVRFFEECSDLGDLYVVVGHDANIRLLKGQGHPMFRQHHRRYMVAAIRHVKQALVSTGSGWMDAAPEIERIRPDMYAVNEDGDKPAKREFCAEQGIEYVVLKRLPREGLPRRESTHLRGS